ncbi:discoidin domain-containing protein [Mycolicibacterium neoaurum]|uniref:discoidin domain-containing protein n=1 Tax=Mycolicibacterium neoaurum TaxID=1795 RepID=UPI001F4C7F9D|nr:discoidin domain-containing protein [Mycolicibacterium neoaurum]
MNPDQPQTDHAWENRRLILASLAPRTATRPARRGAATKPDDALTDITTTKKPGLLTRGLRATGRATAAGGRAFNNKVPRENRTRVAILTAAAVIVLLVALAGVNYLTTDINPPATPTNATAAPPPAPSQAPLHRDTILTGVTAKDTCPSDPKHSDPMNAFDGDFNTAWVCSENKNGQLIQVDFGRQVTVSQIRAIGGFDATAPDGTDQWSKHQIITKLEVWFPKDLRRDPVTIDTGGVRDWRFDTLNPPATVSTLLIRVAETSDPPTPATRETTTPNPDEVTSVAMSEVQFIGIDGIGAPIA